MNLLKSSAVFASVLLVTVACQAQSSFKAGKAVSKFTKDLVSVPLGSFTMGRKTVHTYSEKDSTLFSGDYIRRVEIEQPYYISNHEVTNAEYKEFVRWVIESTQADYTMRKDNSLFNDGKIDYKKVVYSYPTPNGQKTIAVYPDTAAWNTDFPYAYNDPMARLYYKHEAYANYPVVGVSWEQANAYCDWRTNRANDLMKSDNPNQTRVTFRLPTEPEWEYAALGSTGMPEKNMEKQSKKIGRKTLIFPWASDRIMNEKGKYYANFGQVIDQNGLTIKSFFEDGAFHTAPINSYPPNMFMLYDMAGNVAEWVADEPQLLQWKDTLGNTIVLNENDDEKSIYLKLSGMADYLGKPVNNGRDAITRNMRLLEHTHILLHDLKVLRINRQARIVKGGSWATGAVFMQCGAKEVLSENKGSSRIGFRVVMTVENKPQSAER